MRNGILKKMKKVLGCPRSNASIAPPLACPGAFRGVWPGCSTRIHFQQFKRGTSLFSSTGELYYK